MKNISKYNYLFIGVGCFILIGLMSLTYSKFSYQRSLSGSINTIEVESEMTLYDTLLAMDYTLDTNVDFSQGASSTNGQGLMMMSSTQYDEYPIMYYRGDVNNNNLIYAGYCWLIVRTTETGGIKIVYNGEVNEDGSCNNYSNVTAEKEYDSTYSNAYLNKQTYAFNTSYKSPVYVGYMYNDENTYYTSSTLDASGYATHLADNTVDSETGRHTQNLKDSNIKSVIDAWYASNIDGKAEESLLEDAVWCADRSITSTTYTPENYATNNKMFVYGAATRTMEPMMDQTLTVAPSLTCARDVDKFTVDSANGNGDLTHPIGMLTADEILMAGNTLYQGDTVITYLSIPTHVYWALSPRGFNLGAAYAFCVYDGGLDDSDAVDVGYDDPGLRPVVSLGLGAHITGGNGSFQTPYTILS